MDEFVIRKSNQDDADELYDLIVESKGTDKILTRANFRRDLAGVYEHSSEGDPHSLGIDEHLPVPNCPVCQAYLAIDGSQPIGYVIFHYYYTPWRGRYAFIDDTYVRQSYRRKGIAMSLLRMLSEQCRLQGVIELLFNSTNMNRELVDKAKSHDARVARDESADWSVYRIEFNRKSSQGLQVVGTKTLSDLNSNHITQDNFAMGSECIIEKK